MTLLRMLRNMLSIRWHKVNHRPRCVCACGKTISLRKDGNPMAHQCMSEPALNENELEVSNQPSTNQSEVTNGNTEPIGTAIQ